MSLLAVTAFLLGFAFGLWFRRRERKDYVRRWGSGDPHKMRELCGGDK